MPDPDVAPGLALLRVAALSVGQAARLIEDPAQADPFVRTAVQAAVGREVLEAAGDRPRAAQTLTRYLARMGGRATPYGLLAGTAVATVGRERSLRLDERSQHLVRTRIDVAALEDAVAAVLDARPIADWPLRINPLARADGPLLRFARPGDSTADVVTVRITPAIARVRELLAHQVRWGRDLIDELLTWRTELSREQAAGLLSGLVDCGLLERAAGLIAPGVEPAERAVEICAGAGASETADALRALHDDIAGDIPGAVPLRPALSTTWETAWHRAATRVGSFGSVAEQNRYDHQLELATADAVLDTETVHDLVAAVLRVQQVNSADRTEATDPAGWAPEVNLDRFRDVFRARYEDAEVPLLAAADLESGVIQPRGRQLSRLAIDAGITSDRSEEGYARVPQGVLTAYRRFSWSGAAVDIADFPRADALTSRSIAAVLLDDYEGRFRALLVGGVGRSPFALMARFGLGRPALADAMIDQVRAEQERASAASPPAPLYVELAYSPGGRIGNVLLRPQVLPETLALTGTSGGTLALDRLTIRLQGDDFHLRDSETGRPVVVELNTAHNVDFAGLDPVYALLGRLAGGGGAGWHWAGLERLDHLPRITCGSVILSAERWRLRIEQIESVLESREPGAVLREHLGLEPSRRWLGVGSFDHVLPLDLSSARSIRAALARHPAEVQLIELPQLEAPAVTGPDGRHVAEVVIGTGPALRPAPAPPRGDILYCPAAGARWVYARYHCGQASAERVIAEARALVDRLSTSGTADQWFFVRYAADGHHVRLRIRGTTDDARAELLSEMSALGARLAADGIVGRMVLDDYVPEVSRYGGSRTLAVAERLFTASSRQVSDLLATGPSEEIRLFQAVTDLTAWLDLIEPTATQQIAFLARCQSGLGVRFARSGNRHGKLFRTHRAALSAYRQATASDAGVLEAVAELVSVVREQDPAALVRIVGSCLHMHCNRLFAFDAVRLEFLSYELAIRTIREAQARRVSDPVRKPELAS